VVDTHVANALVRASRAVGLLGAQVVLTGIRPEVARTLAQMGSELSGIVIYGTLQSGIVHAMGRSDGANAPRRGGAAQGRGPLR
jgi:rsbT co-antagonist protein RsbR